MLGGLRSAHLQIVPKIAGAEPDTRCPVSQMSGGQDCEGLVSTPGLRTWPAPLCCPVPLSILLPFPFCCSLCHLQLFSLSCLCFPCVSIPSPDRTVTSLFLPRPLSLYVHPLCLPGLCLLASDSPSHPPGSPVSLSSHSSSPFLHWPCLSPLLTQGHTGAELGP